MREGVPQESSGTSMRQRGAGEDSFFFFKDWAAGVPESGMRGSGYKGTGPWGTRGEGRGGLSYAEINLHILVPTSTSQGEIGGGRNGGHRALAWGAESGEPWGSWGEGESDLEL